MKADLKSKVFYELNNIHAFIFEIGSEMLFIGVAVYDSCSEDEKELYISYKTSIIQKSALSEFSSKKDKIELTRIIDTIRQCKKNDITDAEINKASTLLRERIYSCSDDELKSLDRQIDNYQKACRIKDDIEEKEMRKRNRT